MDTNKKSEEKFNSMSDAELVKNYYHYIPENNRVHLTEAEIVRWLKRDYSIQIINEMAGDMRALNMHHKDVK